MTPESCAIHVFCVFETHIQDSHIVIRLTSPSQYKEPIRFTLRVSWIPAATPHGFAGIGFELNTKAGQVLLDCVLIGSRLCAVIRNRMVRNRENIHMPMPFRCHCLRFHRFAAWMMIYSLIN